MSKVRFSYMCKNCWKSFIRKYEVSSCVFCESKNIDLEREIIL